MIKYSYSNIKTTKTFRRKKPETRENFFSEKLTKTVNHFLKLQWQLNAKEEITKSNLPSFLNFLGFAQFLVKG